MLTKKRELGKSGLMVSALGMGCIGFNQGYPPFPSKEEQRTNCRPYNDMAE